MCIQTQRLISIVEFDFYIVDVFAESQFSGNPLAVVVNANALDKATKQAIAAEMNFSETCFLNAMEDNRNGFDLEIYTPSQEIAFAGHPILGAAKVLVDQYYSGLEKTIYFNLKNERVVVEFEYIDDGLHNIWFSSPSVSLGQVVSHDEFAEIVSIKHEILNNTLPIQEISAFTSALMIPFKDRKCLQEFSIESSVFEALLSNNLPKLLYCYTDDTRESQNDYFVRFFFESNGVREDPATGNGAAFFGAYLIEHGVVKRNHVVRIEQGYDIRRPSIILVKLNVADGNKLVSVGGKVVLNVKGQILV